MAHETYEVEIKSLLGSSEAADALRKKLSELDPATTLTAANTQLNHYFEGGDAKALAEAIAPYVRADDAERMRDIAARGTAISVRTREKRAAGAVTVTFVMKASVGDDSSENGVARMELDAPVAISLDELDQAILSAGYRYQAKWSREREEYASGGLTVCLDKNAGYGYLAEFEKVVGSEAETAPARREAEAFMRKLGVLELPQDRLERMFAFYNAHWPEYYGTDAIFTVE